MTASSVSYTGRRKYKIPSALCTHQHQKPAPRSFRFIQIQTSNMKEISIGSSSSYGTITENINGSSIEQYNNTKDPSEPLTNSQIMRKRKRWTKIILLLLLLLVIVCRIPQLKYFSLILNNDNNDEEFQRFTNNKDEGLKEFSILYDGSSSTSSNIPNSLSSFFAHELSWKRVKENDDGSFSYTGYLELCGDYNYQFFYRAVTEMTSDPSEPCSNVTSRQSPLIRMLPRNDYKLVFINRSHRPSNLHTHGLHVAGVGDVDDITRNVDPGNCLVYKYRILDDADVGTFWYHSHRHPLSAKQVAGGAYGMLIVDEPHLEIYPSHLQRFFQNEILLQYSALLNKTSNNRTSRINGMNETLTINMDTTEYYYFRVSFVIISDPINYLEFSPKEACEVRVMAYDGVYRSSMPHPKSNHKHMLTTSSRLDLAVQCKKNATIMFYHSQMSDVSEMVKIRVFNNNTHTQEKDSETIISSSPYWDAIKKTTWNPRRPYYMPDLMQTNSNLTNTSQNIETWNVTMDSVHLPSDGSKVVSINHIRWDPDIAIRQFELNQLVEWKLHKTNKHPFHVHINRMQIAQPGGCGYRYEEGEYYDTVVSNDNLNPFCNIRMQFWDFAGRIVAHCHKLKHEDKGMMVWIDVVGGPEHGMKGTKQVVCSSIV